MIKLIFDPFGISKAEGQKISDISLERRAFQEIDDCLKSMTENHMENFQAYIITGKSCQHFQTYREGIKGLIVVDITPITQVQDIFNVDVPNWLTNDNICDWGLLDRDHPSVLLQGNWAATIAEWLIPGIFEVQTLEQWFRVVSSTNKFPEKFSSSEILDWIVCKFNEVAQKKIRFIEKLNYLKGQLKNASTPVVFAREWVRRVAILPLIHPRIDNPLKCPSLINLQAYDLAVATELPLIFPLPEFCNKEVSQKMQEAILNARVKDTVEFEDVVLGLNAIWDGVSDELRTWLEINPQGMTSESSKHLAKLPGFESDQCVRQLVKDYTPPETVPVWSGLDDKFECWVDTYARFLRSSFIRRDILTNEEDPALGFGRWLKDNYTVSYTHPILGYCSIAKRVQDALISDKTVIVILIDALAIHVVRDAIDFFSDYLKRRPTEISYVFTLLPTMTEICKEPILTGKYPKECSGRLSENISRAYNLSKEEFLIASNWKDAERLKISLNTKLVVYRDNRLDDKLSSVRSYRDLLEDCADIFPRIGRLINRWATDLKCLKTSFPLILLTSDHGFTYGPPPCRKTRKNSDSGRRCIIISDNFSDIDQHDDSVTFIDKEKFHLQNSYVAARGRYFGEDTMSGWALSHGGLLPEEVIIPVVEWFGEEPIISWPEISFPNDALFDRNSWKLRIKLHNPNNMPVYQGYLDVGIAQKDECQTVIIPRIDPGEEILFDFVLDDIDHIQNKPEFRISIRLRHPDTQKEFKKENLHKVTKAIQLIERTTEQDEFESMFRTEN